MAIRKTFTFRKESLGIDVKCPNKDGMTPMYLAKFFGGDACDWDSPWCKFVDVIKSSGGNLQYPTLGSECFLVTTFYKGFVRKLHLHLTDQEMALLQNNGRRECQNYTTKAAVDLIRAYDDFERVCNDYQIQGEKCAIFRRIVQLKILVCPTLTICCSSFIGRG